MEKNGKLLENLWINLSIYFIFFYSCVISSFNTFSPLCWYIFTFNSFLFSILLIYLIFIIFLCCISIVSFCIHFGLVSGAKVSNVFRIFLTFYLQNIQNFLQVSTASLPPPAFRLFFSATFDHCHCNIFLIACEKQPATYIFHFQYIHNNT